jgi:hypothetical protein
LAIARLSDFLTSFPSGLTTMDSTTPRPTLRRSRYSATGNYPKEDDGANERDVLTYLANTGVTNAFGTHKILFAALDPRNINEIKFAIQYLGGCYFGWNLPVAAQTQDVWQMTAAGTAGAGAPGSWGGHCTMSPAYDGQSVTVATWGKLLKVTPDFIENYCEEAWALVSEDWLADSGISPPGLNMAGLQAEMKAIQD